MTLGDLNSFTAVGHCIRNASGQPELVSAMQCKYGNWDAHQEGKGKEEKTCNFSLSEMIDT